MTAALRNISVLRSISVHRISEKAGPQVQEVPVPKHGFQYQRVESVKRWRQRTSNKTSSGSVGKEISEHFLRPPEDFFARLRSCFGFFSGRFPSSRFSSWARD